MSQKVEEIKVINDEKEDDYDDDDEDVADIVHFKLDQKDNEEEEEDYKVSDVVFKQNTAAQDLWNKKVLNQRAERHPLAHAKGGYIMQDKDHVIRRGLKIILKSVGSKLIKGQFLDVLKFSKPSVLSFPLSYVQAILRDFQYMPKFLFQASKQADPFQRLKLVTTSIVAGYHAAVQILGVRGFLNPILGQTFHAKCLEYGTQIFVQQTCHHPPITHYSIISQNFEVNGYGEIWAGMNGMNSVKGGRKGRMVIKIKDAQDSNKSNVYTVIDPQIKIKNLVMGQKTFLFTKGSSIKDHNNKLEADILLKPKEKGKISKMFGAVTGLFKSKKKTADPFQILKKKAEDSFLIQISQQALNGKQKKCLMRGHGSWLEGVWFQDKEYWNIGDSPQKFVQSQEQKLMPSDSCKRKDLQFMLQNNYPEAEKAKNQLEIQQRKDKADRIKSQKLRKKAAKKK